MAKFKCQHTGNIVEFTAEHDIDAMRKHTEYTEIFDYVGEKVKLEEVKPVVKPRKTASAEE